MPDWLLRVEAVNFAATMNDTTDLSTQRGASLTALDAGDAVRRRLHYDYPADRVEEVFVGASQAVFVLKDFADAGEVLARVRAQLRTAQGSEANRPLYATEEAPPVARMTFVAAVAPLDGRALAAAEAMAKRLQLQSPTLPPHPPPAPEAAARHRRACPIERRLPADKPHSVRKDMLPDAVEFWRDPEHDEKRVLVSSSVAERRSYGRSARQRFYRKLLGPDVVLPRFADGLIDLVNAAPATVPLPLRGKVAVICADGIGFDKLLKAVQEHEGDPIAGVRSFSAAVDELNTRVILEPLIAAFGAAWQDGGERRSAVAVPHDKADNPEARREKWPQILRFETLTYAGEDIVWLVPSWLAWEVVGFLFAVTATAEIAERVPEYRVGCAITSYKMPMRKAKGLAHALERLVTAGVPEEERRAGAQLELVESIDVSDSFLEAHRKRLAGTRLALDFTITAEHFEAVTAHVHALRHPRGLPPSQLHRLLRLAAQRGAFFNARGKAEVEEALKLTLQRADYRYGAGGDGERLDSAHLASAALGAANDPLFGLLRLAQLWDVVLPLGEPVLGVPGR